MATVYLYAHARPATAYKAQSMQCLCNQEAEQINRARIVNGSDCEHHHDLLPVYVWDLEERAWDCGDSPQRNHTGQLVDMRMQLASLLQIISDC